MKLDDIKKLHQKKYRESSGRFIVEGEHLVLELQRAAQRNSNWSDCELYLTERHANWQSPFRTHVVSERQMAQLSETQSPQGILAVASLGIRIDDDETARAIYLHEIQDPGNLGTILRSLAWFGGFRCLLSPNSVDPYNGKAVRASMGAIFHVPIECDIELDALVTRFDRIACLDMRGETIASPRFGEFDCYVFGNEARGVPREQIIRLHAQSFTIPGSGRIDSLNLGSAVNVCVYELTRMHH